MQISSNINSIYTISWILWNSRGPPHDDIIICNLDEYIYTPHKLLVMPNIFLIYSSSLSLTPVNPQAFEVLMSKSSIFSKKHLAPKGLIQSFYLITYMSCLLFISMFTSLVLLSTEPSACSPGDRPWWKSNGRGGCGICHTWGRRGSHVEGQSQYA